MALPQRGHPFNARIALGVGALMLAGALLCAWGYAISPANGFMPHGVCYAWNPSLIRLHAFSDALIGLAYFSIPPALWYFVRKRADLPFSWIFLLFGLFIVACGSTHWMELWTLWRPDYWASGMVKAFTAAASVPTAVALVLLIPHALSIPSHAHVRKAKEDLEAEIVERNRIEAQLRQARIELEARVAERTTELALVNQELQRQREWFSTTLSSIGDAVIATGTQGEVLLLNKGAEELTGWSQADAAGKPLSEVFNIINEHTRLPPPNPALRAIEEETVVRLANHTILIARNGVEKAIDDSAAPIRDEQGRILGAVLVFRDISERRRAEQALHESEQRYRSLFDNNLDPIFSLDAEGRFFMANAAAERISGYTLEELKQTHFLRLCVPEARSEAAQAFRDGLCRKCSDMESAMVHKNGRRVDLFVTGAPVLVDDQVVGVACIARDITERKAAEVERAALAAIVSGSDDAIIGKTLNGIVTSWNAGAQRMFGYSAGEMIGESITKLLPEDRVHEEKHILARLRAGERIDHYQSKRRRKDGRVIDVSLTVSPIRDGAGNIVGASKIARDITEQKKAEEALQEADRNKDEFLAMLGHELRNPLAPIRNAVELLRYPEPAHAQHIQAREVIDRQVQHLTRLVDDLLDVSRITRGLINIRAEPVELCENIRHAVDSARPLLEAREHKLELILPEQPVHTLGDPARLSQVFFNLLSNAIKYTGNGGHISVSMARGEHEALIRVNDNGVGIAPEALEKIFELFVQGERALDRSEGGLGIGLTLARRLVEVQGGSIVAFSEGPGRGSEFTVRLPVVEAPIARADTDAPRPRNSKAGMKLRMLVVDDNRDAAQSLGLLLELWGHEVSIANDGVNALAIAKEWGPEVVLLDLGLPGMTGYEVASKLREDYFKGTIIAITGYGTPNDRRRTQLSGFDAHLVKPVNLQELEALLADRS
jgi:PAS domain S-box-containing protein